MNRNHICIAAEIACLIGVWTTGGILSLSFACSIVVLRLLRSPLSPFWGLALAAGLLNWTAMAVNGGRMPVHALGMVYANRPTITDTTHSVLTNASHLPIICDVILIPHFGAASAGDFVLIVGIGWGMTDYLAQHIARSFQGTERAE